MALKTGEQQVCFACHFSAGIKDLQAMESEQEIRMSQLHEQLLQSATRRHLRMAPKKGIPKNRSVVAPATFLQV